MPFIVLIFIFLVLFLRLFRRLESFGGVSERSQGKSPDDSGTGQATHTRMGTTDLLGKTKVFGFKVFLLVSILLNCLRRVTLVNIHLTPSANQHCEGSKPLLNI